MSPYDEADCVAAVKEAAEVLGHSPSLREYSKLDISPSCTVIQERVGWNETKRRAGLELYEDSGQPAFTKEECVKALQAAVEETGEDPLHRDTFMELDTPMSYWTVRNYFGGWRRAQEAAGLEVTEPLGRGTRYTQKEIRETVREVAESVGHAPTAEEFKQHDTAMHVSTIYTHYDLWVECLLDAGIEPAHGMNTNAATIEHVREALHRATVELGKTPTIREYENSGIWPGSVAVDRVTESSNWVEQLDELDIKVTEGYVSYTRNDILEELDAVEKVVGRPPTPCDYEVYANGPSLETLERLYPDAQVDREEGIQLRASSKTMSGVLNQTATDTT